MLSEFIRRCFMAPEIEEEILKTAHEAGLAAEATHRAAKAAEKAVKKADVASLFRMILGFAIIGIFTAGYFTKAAEKMFGKQHAEPDDKKKESRQ